MNFKIYFEKLFNYYKVSTITDLAQCLGLSQPTVTNWQRRNSINAIKKRCRELGIYDEIFGDFNSNITQVEIIKINNTLLEQAKNEASKFGLDINSYLEHLIIQDLKK